MYRDELIRIRGRYQEFLEEEKKRPGELIIRATDGSWRMSMVTNAHGSHSVWVPRSSAKTIESSRITGVLDVSSQNGEIEGENRDYLEVACLDPHLTEVFDDLAIDFAEKVYDDESRNPESVLYELIDRWRELLSLPRREVREKDIVGLLGEMLVFRELLMMGLIPGISAWSGPDGHRHDFITRGADIEVKSTTSVRPHQLLISREDQFDLINNVPLLLARVALVKHPTGQSIRDLKESLNRLGIEPFLINERIERVLGQFVPKYVDERYAHIETNYYLVNDDFPRLKVENGDQILHPAILDYQYLIDLSDLEKLSQAELGEYVAGE